MVLLNDRAVFEPCPAEWRIGRAIRERHRTFNGSRLGPPERAVRGTGEGLARGRRRPRRSGTLPAADRGPASSPLSARIDQDRTGNPLAAEPAHRARKLPGTLPRTWPNPLSASQPDLRGIPDTPSLWRSPRAGNLPRPFFSRAVRGTAKVAQ